jgi:hypothetical protein
VSAEEQILHKKYASDPSKLAEALCDDGEVGEQARRDWQLIKHVKYPLATWLPADTLQKTSLAAMVLEPGFDFDAQVDSSIRWAVSQSYGDNAAKCIGNTTELEIGVSSEEAHSSHGSDYDPAPLSNLGQCCVARHVATSYELILEMADVACQGDLAHHCQAALLSIHNRRKDLLNDSKSCQELAVLM